MQLVVVALPQRLPGYRVSSRRPDIPTQKAMDSRAESAPSWIGTSRQLAKAMVDSFVQCDNRGLSGGGR